MVYNVDSPTTLLSEYQIRENGFICNSVAKKHKASQDSNGKQRLELSEHVNIPFVDRGGLMAFEILLIEGGDIDKIDPVIDIFEITNSAKWIPARFCTASNTVSVEVSNMNTKNDEFLESLDYQELVHPKDLQENNEEILNPESFLFRHATCHDTSNPRHVHPVHVRPWHQTLCKSLSPGTLG